MRRRDARSRESCFGRPPLPATRGSDVTDTETQDRPLERLMDAIDAYRRADAWITEIASTDEGPHRQIRRLSFTEEDGGLIVYEFEDRPRAIAVVLRDSWNYSLALRVFPARPRGADPILEVAGEVCEDCPPVGYQTDKTRCLPCPRRNPDEGEGPPECCAKTGGGSYRLSGRGAGHTC